MKAVVFHRRMVKSRARLCVFLSTDELHNPEQCSVWNIGVPLFGQVLVNCAIS